MFWGNKYVYIHMYIYIYIYIYIYTYNEVPPINITEQVQFTFKVDIHYIWLYPIQVDITTQKHIGNKYIYIYTYICIYT